MKKGLLLFFLSILTLQAFSQCATVSITQSAPTICSGSTVTLTANTSGGSGPFSYTWSTGQSSQSISVDKGGTYTVTVSSSGCPPANASALVTATTTPAAPTAPAVLVCPGSPATLTATAPGGTYQWYSAAVGGTFLATGATYVTPPINFNTAYYVETTINGCTSSRTEVFVNLPPKPDAQPATTCAGNVATLTATGGTNYTWYDEAGNAVGTGDTFTTPPLTSNVTYYVSTLSANGCNSLKTAVPVTVTAPPGAPTAKGVTICSGSAANLQATGASGTFNWYSVPTGGTPLISSPNYTTPPLTANATYYVSNEVNDCEGTRTPVTVTVNPLPATPSAQNDTTCYQSSITLTASGSAGAAYQWFNAPGGTLLYTGTTYTTPVLNFSTTYYIRAVNGGCASSFTPINVFVKQQLASPSATGPIICSGTTATLTASSQGGGTFQWYSAQTGGTLLASGQTFTTPALNANTTYYLQNTQAGCVSPRAPVTVTVLAPIAAPGASNHTICAGDSASLSASGSSGVYEWYDQSTGGNLLSTNQVYVTPALMVTTTYYVEAESNNCPSPRTPVTVTVNPTPTIVANDNTICPGATATLTATTNTGTISWYNAATGGNLLATGPSYTTPVLYSTTTYYVESVSGPCSTGRTPVSAVVNPTYNPQFEYPLGGYCVGSSNPTPTINNPNGGVFSSQPGLVFVSTTTGEINIGASSIGSYTVYFAGNGPCAGVESTVITIGTFDNTTFSYNSPFCQSQPDPLASTSGSYSASPAGLVFVNTVTGEIDLVKSTPGTYTITNNVPASPSCSGTPSMVQITIYPEVFVSAGPDQTVAIGSQVQLAGSISGGATTGTWSGGTGTFSDPTSPTAIYTPGPGETSAKLNLISTLPPGNCGPGSASVTITFVTQPAAPTANNATTCAGSSVTLSATSPGGTYQWYDAPTGGNLLSTGANFTTPALNASTTYYLQTTVNGVTSNRTAVTVFINAIPAAPVSPSTQVCSGNIATLAATGSTGAYQWFDAASGGNLLSNNSTYTTPPITGNIAFYVQTIVNGCTSARTEVDVTVVPDPVVTSAPNGSICSGQALNYTITGSQPNVTFTWSRPAVAGISNPAVANDTSSTITETLVNTTFSTVNVVYTITPFNGACAGHPFNYVVSVYPVPSVTSAAVDTICSGTDNNYTVTFNSAVSNFSWSRAAVPGISNLAVSGQSATTIREALFNTTNTAVNVTYVFTYGTANCQGMAFNLVVTVNPQATITSAAKGTACYGEPQDYGISANIAGATYSWSRNYVTGISNPQVSNQTSSVITETLTNTTSAAINVTYVITPLANGCPGTPFNYVVTVYPKLTSPVATSNSPVCIGDTINLSTVPVANSTYLWTGPNGFTSTLQNPQITNANPTNDGVYSLTYNTKGCNSATVTVSVTVDALPLAVAGPDLDECTATTEIPLTGTVTGGTTTGIWSTSGTGTFSPSPSDLTANYVPSTADKNSGSVILTLTSTSQDNCKVSTSSLTITFTKLPAVTAGPDQLICTQSPVAKLNGSVSISGGGTWSSEGTGTFSPSITDLNATYTASPADVANGKVVLKLTANDPGVCFKPVDSLSVFFIPPPAVFGGGTKYVLKGSTVTLYPTVSETNVHYLWSPDVEINNDTLKDPTITGDVNNMVYTLTVTDSRGCVSSDTVLIKVTPLIKLTNTFTPNGDGINDYWDIDGLIAYVNATVDIFDRYGQQVFHSIGYPKPWDGTYNGKQVPAGVYYYIINTHFNGEVLSGYVTVLR